tara:strand:+ start:187 stop:603 length:417 start_codon:yes stop_codon:yes gene_type:complete
MLEKIRKQAQAKAKRTGDTYLVIQRKDDKDEIAFIEDIDFMNDRFNMYHNWEVIEAYKTDYNDMGFTKEQLNRLLNTACEIIIELEHNADDEQQKRINAMFDEIKYTEDIDEEITLQDDNLKADLEAQDYDVFGNNKI